LAYPDSVDAVASHAPARGRRHSVRRFGLALTAALLLLGAAGLPTDATWPVASRSSYVSQWYSRGHRADDLAATRGTRIVPILSGRVVFAGWKSNCGGYQVWINHGNRRYTAYYHMSREVVYAGKTVARQSTTLGYVGSSGCASGPHVHVEVWNGVPWGTGSYRINPWPYIDSGYYLPYRYR
jgi:murein DD-endopeptidase MepM/ murein hydrolase activator NlpD